MGWCFATQSGSKSTPNPGPEGTLIFPFPIFNVEGSRYFTVYQHADGKGKHVAAVLYGVGARLDERPELFFVLRNVDHNELLAAAGAGAASTAGVRPGRALKSKDPA